MVKITEKGEARNKKPEKVDINTHAYIVGSTNFRHGKNYYSANHIERQEDKPNKGPKKAEDLCFKKTEKLLENYHEYCGVISEYIERGDIKKCAYFQNPPVWNKNKLDINDGYKPICRKASLVWEQKPYAGGRSTDIVLIGCPENCRFFQGGVLGYLIKGGFYFQNSFLVPVWRWLRSVKVFLNNQPASVKSTFIISLFVFIAALIWGPEMLDALVRLFVDLLNKR